MPCISFPLLNIPHVSRTHEYEGSHVNVAVTLNDDIHSAKGNLSEGHPNHARKECVALCCIKVPSNPCQSDDIAHLASN